MRPQEPARISLELDPAVEPITGRLYEERGRVRAFSGWLALFAALETAAAELMRQTEESSARREAT